MVGSGAGSRSMADDFVFDRFNDMANQLARARSAAIEMVCRIAYSRNSPYGVLVDCDGVRIDKDVPANTVHYRDTDCQYNPQWTAVLTVPE